MLDAHQDLVERAARGDASALNGLFERHVPTLLAYVRLHAGAELRAHESLMDLVQSTCREVLQDLDQLRQRDEAHFKQWLFEASERKILDRARYWRREKRDAGQACSLTPEDEHRLLEGYSRVVTPSRVAGAREELERVERAFERLPQHFREVILLARVVGLSHADIAERLGRDEASSRDLLRRALARLGRFVSQPGAES